MKSKFAAFTDSLFLRLLLFAGLFMWAGFYLSAFDAAFAAFAAAVSVAGLLRGRSRPVDGAETDFADTVLVQLSVLPRDKAVDLVYEALSKRFRPVRTDNGVQVKHTYVYPAFSPEPLSAEALNAAVCSSPSDRILVLTTAGVSPAAGKLIGRLNADITVKEGDDVYRLFKQTGVFPSITVRAPKKARKGLYAFKGAFSRDKTRKYLFASAVLFLGAYVLPYAVYYLIAASACLVAAVLCLLPAGHRKKVR